MAIYFARALSYPKFGMCCHASTSFCLMVLTSINGNFRILNPIHGGSVPHKAICWGDIPLHRPKKIGLIYGIGTSNKSVPEMAIDFIHVRFLNWIYPVYVWFIMENHWNGWCMGGTPHDFGNLQLESRGLFPKSLIKIYMDVCIQRGAPKRDVNVGL